MAVDPTRLAGRARQNWLRSAARRIRRHPRRALSQVVALGRLLTQVKAVVGRGRWIEWLEVYWPHHRQLAAQTMRAAKILGNYEMSALRTFGTSSAHALTHNSLSKSSRDNILRAPARRRPIGLESVKLLKLAATDDDFDPKTDYAACEVISLPRPGDADAFRRLATLLARADFVTVDVSRDVDALPDAPPDAVTIAVFGEGGSRRFCRRSLESALAAAAGEEVLKKCPKCKEAKSPDEYAAGTRYCRVCERRRVKRYGKKGKRTAAG